MTDVVLQIKGMTCGHCQMAVSKALRGVKGVEDAQVDLQAGQAKVRFDEAKAGLAELRAAVEEAGYQVVGSRGA